MRDKLMAAAAALLAGLFLNATPAAGAEGAGACAQIRKACRDAGFVAGGMKAGNGLKADCFEPILHGSARRPSASRPLPSLDAATVAACQADGSPTDAPAEADMPAEGPAAEPAAPAVAPTAGGAGAGRPNFVFILADDFSMNLLSARDDMLKRSMPNLMKMQSEGVTFASYFVTDSLCCPSRSSIFTGKLPHNTGVYTNRPPFGGYDGFMKHGNESHTFAVALQKGGYRTAMLGKYLNGYEPAKDGVPKGWSEWDVDGSRGYQEVNYPLNENGKVRNHAEYLTDEISLLGREFIKKSASGPFFIEFATFAPHAPYVPPARYRDDFPTLSYDQSLPFGARLDANAPDWLKEVPALEQKDIDAINKAFRKRVRSDRAIDDLIRDVRAELVRLGIDKNTYVIFSSDNGYHMGEYSLRPGKMTPFDTDVQVPLIVVGPGVPAGQVLSDLVENVDLCPTFTELGGASGATDPDGQSLVALLRPGYVGDPAHPWRRAVLIEHHHAGPNKPDPDLPAPKSGNPPTYEALRTATALYVEYSDAKHEIGYYDLQADPLELRNVAASLPPASLKRWHEALHANAVCKGARECRAAQQLVP